MAAATEAYQYATQEITEAVDQLGRGTKEIEDIVTQLKANVELNFEGWVGGSKEEFNRVHQEATDHVVGIAQWLVEVRGLILQILEQVMEREGEQAVLIEQA